MPSTCSTDRFLDYNKTVLVLSFCSFADYMEVFPLHSKFINKIISVLVCLLLCMKSQINCCSILKGTP